MPIPNSYDHKRHHAANEVGNPYPAEAPVPIWDFVITQQGGRQLRIHPSLKKGTVEISAISQPAQSIAPKAGKGRSDGPGTYRGMLSQAYEEGRVSAHLPRPKPKGKAKPKAKSHPWQ